MVETAVISPREELKVDQALHILAPLALFTNISGDFLSLAFDILQDNYLNWRHFKINFAALHSIPVIKALYNMTCIQTQLLSKISQIHGSINMLAFEEIISEGLYLVNSRCKDELESSFELDKRRVGSAESDCAI